MPIKSGGIKVNKNELFKKLKGGLVVSCQALPGEPLYKDEGGVMPLMAKAAVMAGACAIRANSVRDIIEIKEYVDLPVIGIIKKQYEGFTQHITVTMTEIDALMSCHTDIIALDCTDRPRPDGRTVKEFIDAIKTKYPEIVLMADISNFNEAKMAVEAGVDCVGTTLSGYTGGETSSDPDFELVREIATHLDTIVIAEGKIHYPEQAQKMIEYGADIIVVGGAITRPLEITNRFLDAINRGNA